MLWDFALQVLLSMATTIPACTSAFDVFDAIDTMGIVVFILLSGAVDVFFSGLLLTVSDG